MPAHMTSSVVAKVEMLGRKKGATPAQVFKELAQKIANPPSESAVRRVLAGRAYQRGKMERRGRPRKATKQVVRKYETALSKLRRKAKSRYRVTNAMIMNTAKLKGKMTVRCVTDQVKAEKGTRFYPARKKLDRTVEEEKRRSEQSETWGQRPASFWTARVLSYHEFFVHLRAMMPPGSLTVVEGGGL